VIKMVLALRHGLLPATLHAGTASPQVDWSVGDVELLTEPVEWLANGRPRRAGVSAFGISGTNAHLILEEPPAPADDEQPAGSAPVELVPLLSNASAWLVSGQSKAGLLEQARRLVGHLTARPELDSADVAGPWRRPGQGSSTARS